MTTPLLVPIAATVLLGSGFVTNEWSHGGMSETMGLGHHHMLDYGGYHCARHDDAEHSAHHMTHMHRNATMTHDACPGGKAMHGGMMRGGMGDGPPGSEHAGHGGGAHG